MNKKRQKAIIVLIFMFIIVGSNVDETVAQLDKKRDVPARIIEGITYTERQVFEKEAKKRWEEATPEERQTFLSRVRANPHRTTPQKKASVSSKSIFDTGKSSTNANTAKPTLKKPVSSMGGRAY